MVKADGEWSGDDFVKQSNALAQGIPLSLRSTRRFSLSRPCALPVLHRWRVAVRRRTAHHRRFYNPSTGDGDRRSAHSAAPRRSIAAVDAAAAAFSRLARNSPGGARAVFFRYRQLIEDNFRPALARPYPASIGKTLVEARGSVYRGLENVEYACGAPTLLMGDTLENLARNVDCETLTSSRSASASASRRSISQPWCRSGCSRWRWSAEIPSS